MEKGLPDGLYYSHSGVETRDRRFSSSRDVDALLQTYPDSWDQGYQGPRKLHQSWCLGYLGNLCSILGNTCGSFQQKTSRGEQTKRHWASWFVEQWSGVKLMDGNECRFWYCMIPSTRKGIFTRTVLYGWMNVQQTSIFLALGTSAADLLGIKIMRYCRWSWTFLQSTRNENETKQVLVQYGVHDHSYPPSWADVGMQY